MSAVDSGDARAGRAAFDRRIRVIQIVNSLAIAGAERFTADLARSLDVREWDVRVMVVRDGPLRSVLDDAGIPVTVVGGEFDWRFPLSVVRMRRELRRLRPEIVHTHMIGSDIVGSMAVRCAQGARPVLLSTQHDSYRRPGIYDAYRRVNARRLDAVVAVAPELADYCGDALHVPPGRVHVIESGVDQERFHGAVREPGPVPVFGALGSLIPVKGHETLVRAFARIHDQVPGTRLVIAGDGPLLAELETLAQDLGAGDAVELRGRVSDVPAFLGDIDILVHPSRQEGLPLAVLEAMSAGKAVIASDLPALRRVLDDGAAGVLVPPGDDAALSGAMRALVEDRTALGHLQTAALDRVYTRYTLQRMAAEYAALYRELLERRRP